MNDDPTQWFRPKSGRPEGETPGGPPEPAPTEAMPAADAPSTPAGGVPGPDATQALDRDDLSDLFGQQRDYSDESDWLPAAAGSDTPTAVYGAQQPGADPLGWLGDGSTAPQADQAATTVAFGAAVAAGAGSPAAQGYPGEPVPPAGDGEEPAGSKRTIIILAIIGALLVVGIAIALVALLTSGSGAPSSSRSADPSAASSPSTSATPSTTPSTSPSASPTPTPTTPTPAATIGSFGATPATPPCAAASGTVNVTFSWSTSNATTVSLAIDGGPVVDDQLSASGTLSNVPYDCSRPSVGYTLTAANAKGIQTQKSVTLTRPTIPSEPPSAAPSPSPSVPAADGSAGG